MGRQDTHGGEDSLRASTRVTGSDGTLYEKRGVAYMAKHGPGVVELWHTIGGQVVWANDPLSMELEDLLAVQRLDDALENAEITAQALIDELRQLRDLTGFPESLTVEKLLEGAVDTTETIQSLQKG